MTNNPARGCGKLVAGGTYLRGAPMSRKGTYCPLVWVLGTHVLNGSPNMLKTVPPRGQYLFDPELSFERGLVLMSDEAAVIRRDLGFKDSTQPQIAALGKVGILDHVGSSHYTPWSFATELSKYGPSRKVDPDFAALIAPYLPLKIFFTHSDLPFFTSPSHRESFLRQIMEAPEASIRRWSYGPTWEDPTWSWRVKFDRDEMPIMNFGETHYMGQVLRFLSTTSDRWDTYRHEAIFCGSWIMDAVYVCKPGEQDAPPALKQSGIIPLIPDPESEEPA